VGMGGSGITESWGQVDFRRIFLLSSIFPLSPRAPALHHLSSLSPGTRCIVGNAGPV
jgi:hypothetical protein